MDSSAMAVSRQIDQRNSSNTTLGMKQPTLGHSAIASVDEGDSSIQNQTDSNTVQAKAMLHLEQLASEAVRDVFDQTNTTAQNGEGIDLTAASKRKKLSMLESVDTNKQFTTFDEIDSRMNYGYKQVAAEKKPLDHLLDNLDEACFKVLDSHIDRLAWQFKPKLALAQEKVAKLEQIVKQKEKQREEREQLVKLNKQIAHFKMMEKQLTARRDKLKESIEEKRWIREDTS